jgi:hypothetical protein
MRLNDEESHFRFLRMSSQIFDDLVTRVTPLLKR